MENIVKSVTFPSFVCVFWKWSIINADINGKYANAAAFITRFAGCFYPIYLNFYLVMIFVHPADSRAQPSVQAASHLIGQMWGYKRGSNVIGQTKLRPGSIVIGWTWERVWFDWLNIWRGGCLYSRPFYSRMDLFIKPVEALCRLWGLKRPFGEWGLEASLVSVSLKANAYNPVSNFVL